MTKTKWYWSFISHNASSNHTAETSSIFHHMMRSNVWPLALGRPFVVSSTGVVQASGPGACWDPREFVVFRVVLAVPVKLEVDGGSGDVPFVCWVGADGPRGMVIMLFVRASFGVAIIILVILFPRETLWVFRTYKHR